jgi:hypothetical protein
VRDNTPGGDLRLPPGLRREGRHHMLTDLLDHRHQLAARFDESGVQPAAFAIE